MPTSIEITSQLITALLNENRQRAVSPRQLATIYQHLLDITTQGADMSGAIDKVTQKADRALNAWPTYNGDRYQNLNDNLSTGFYPYCILGRPKFPEGTSVGYFSAIVIRTTTRDQNNLTSILQLAWGRSNDTAGRVFLRMIFNDGTSNDYRDWTELTPGQAQEMARSAAKTAGEAKLAISMYKIENAALPLCVADGILDTQYASIDVMAAYGRLANAATDLDPIAQKIRLYNQSLDEIYCERTVTFYPVETDGVIDMVSEPFIMNARDGSSYTARVTFNSLEAETGNFNDVEIDLSPMAGTAAHREFVLDFDDPDTLRRINGFQAETNSESGKQDFFGIIECFTYAMSYNEFRELMDAPSITLRSGHPSGKNSLRLTIAQKIDRNIPRGEDDGFTIVSHPFVPIVNSRATGKGSGWLRKAPLVAVLDYDTQGETMSFTTYPLQNFIDSFE